MRKEPSFLDMHNNDQHETIVQHFKKRKKKVCLQILNELENSLVSTFALPLRFFNVVLLGSVCM